MAVHFRSPQPTEIPELNQFLFEHGKNPWNYLNPPEIEAHLHGIKTGETGGILAKEEGRLVGFVTYAFTEEFLRFQPEDRKVAVRAQISEAVIHPDFRGRGLAPEMLRRCVEALTRQGVLDIYVERHEENLASARMMVKAGFIVLETFDDPERRTSGSRRTAISKYQP